MAGEDSAWSPLVTMVKLAPRFHSQCNGPLLITTGQRDWLVRWPYGVDNAMTAGDKVYQHCHNAYTKGVVRVPRNATTSFSYLGYLTLTPARR